ncbi:MAG TPA: VOC family protein, partial [Deinococcales bacterium]|nr:VOC family protein [Deinococcales bacterium]
MLKRLTRVVLYTPDLQAAVEFYTRLGAQVASAPGAPIASAPGAPVTSAPGAPDASPLPSGPVKGRRVELAFPLGGASLVLHDDPLAQFVDVELETGCLETLGA